ncbi:MAG: hypothetical protein QHH02_01755 [Syntrophomonadaceae bacterium]|nr:hypothetical protein [Syntrophomonadaceae bacterium]
MVWAGLARTGAKLQQGKGACNVNGLFSSAAGNTFVLFGLKALAVGCGFGQNEVLGERGGYGETGLAGGVGVIGADDGVAGV